MEGGINRPLPREGAEGGEETAIIPTFPVFLITLVTLSHNRWPYLITLVTFTQHLTWLDTKTEISVPVILQFILHASIYA